VQKFGKCSAILLAVASNFWLLLWLIGPVGQTPGQDLHKLDVTKWLLHTGIFMLYAAASYLCALANYLEAVGETSRGSMDKSSTVFIIVYGCVTVYLVLVYLLDHLTYKEGQPPKVRPFLTHTADIVWMTCVFFISFFSLKGHPLKVTTEVIEAPPSPPQPQEPLSPSSLTNGQPEGHICTCPKWLANRFAIFKLLGQPLHDRIFHPSIYLSASHEVLAITLTITWAWTWTFHSEQILDHPAFPIIGSYSPCFGWDYAPASWFAVVACSMNVLLTWRYSWLEQTRSIIRRPEGRTAVQKFGKCSAILLAVASNFWLLQWLIGPLDQEPGQPLDRLDVTKWFVHFGIFFTYAATSYLCALANYLEAVNDRSRDKVVKSSTVFIIVYGCSLVFWAFVYVCNLAMYGEGMPPVLRPFYTHTADILWIACMLSITSFLPKEPPLKVTTEIFMDMDQVEFIAE